MIIMYNRVIIIKDLVALLVFHWNRLLCLKYIGLAGESAVEV